MKGVNRDISEFVTKFVGNRFIIFAYINLSPIHCKIFATQCLFTDHWKHKTVKKLVKCPQQTLINYVHIK